MTSNLLSLCILLVSLFLILCRSNTLSGNDCKDGCTCAANEPCVVNCNGQDICKDPKNSINAGQATSLTLNCNGDGACDKVKIDCGSAQICTINCDAGSEKDSCKNIKILFCRSSICTINCSKQDQCNGNPEIIDVTDAQSFQCNGDYCHDEFIAIEFTMKPTTNPPTPKPTDKPSLAPTDIPSSQPSNIPSSQPSNTPSSVPTYLPSINPTYQPTSGPTKKDETRMPTNTPSKMPTQRPTHAPTETKSEATSSTTESVVKFQAYESNSGPDQTVYYLLLTLLGLLMLFGISLCCILAIYVHFKEKRMEDQVEKAVEREISRLSMDNAIPGIPGMTAVMSASPIAGNLSPSSKHLSIDGMKQTTINVTDIDDLFEESSSNRSNSKNGTNDSNAESSSVSSSEYDSDGSDSSGSETDGNLDIDDGATNDTAYDAMPIVDNIMSNLPPPPVYANNTHQYIPGMPYNYTYNYPMNVRPNQLMAYNNYNLSNPNNNNNNFWHQHYLSNLTTPTLPAADRNDNAQVE